MNEGFNRRSREHRQDLAGEYRWGDLGQNILLIVFIVGMVADVFLVKISSWQDVIPWYFRVVCFVPLFVFGWYVVQQAYKKVFQEERKGLEVITTGVYAWLRHPMYFGLLMIYLSFILLSLSVIALVIFGVAVIFYYYLCRYEEQLLIAKLGDEYKEYMMKVPMFIPRVKR